jgi:hypothetical protein
MGQTGESNDSAVGEVSGQFEQFPKQARAAGYETKISIALHEFSSSCWVSSSSTGKFSSRLKNKLIFFCYVVSFKLYVFTIYYLLFGGRTGGFEKNFLV